MCCPGLEDWMTGVKKKQQHKVITGMHDRMDGPLTLFLSIAFDDPYNLGLGR